MPLLYTRVPIHSHHIQHIQQVTILREGLHGFVFESNRGTRVTMTANSPLGPQFNFGWNNKKGKKFKTKVDVTRDKVTYMYMYMHAATILSHVTSVNTCIYMSGFWGGGQGGGGKLKAPLKVSVLPLVNFVGSKTSQKRPQRCHLIMPKFPGGTCPQTPSRYWCFIIIECFQR